MQTLLLRLRGCEDVAMMLAMADGLVSMVSVWCQTGVGEWCLWCRCGATPGLVITELVVGVPSTTAVPCSLRVFWVWLLV